MNETPSVKGAGRILVIRGGAIGDFVLTLPAIALLREAFPAAELDILGYPHIACLAEGRHYARQVRSIEYGPMAGFFVKNGKLDPALAESFAGYHQVISYLFDPDGIFEANLRRAGVRHFLPAYARPKERHAAREWAAPLEKLALFLEDPAARLYPNAADESAAEAWLCGTERPRLALHPGSGSASKNWEASGWREVARRFLSANPSAELVLVSGEADDAVLKDWRGDLPKERIRHAAGLPLPVLAAVLRRVGRFAGHDSGISHIAAAVGARCALLFGPTDPAVWAPQNEGVRIVRAPEGDWTRLHPGAVWQAVESIL